MLFLNKKEELKNWFVKNAESPKAKWWLSIISFSESSIFPIPPDPFLIAVLLVKRHCWLWYSLLVSATSVLGGIFGYLVGLLLFGIIGESVINFYGLEEEFTNVAILFANNAFWAVFIAAFTPVPYKIFTIGAGLFGVNFLIFILASILGRTIRFLIIGFLMKVFGKKIGELVFKYFNTITIIIVLVIAFYLFFKLIV